MTAERTSRGGTSPMSGATAGCWRRPYEGACVVGTCRHAAHALRLPPEPDDRHTRHAVILDGLPFGSVVEAATYAGLTPQTLYMALHRGRDVRGHTIRYAKEER